LVRKFRSYQIREEEIGNLVYFLCSQGFTYLTERPPALAEFFPIREGHGPPSYFGAFEFKVVRLHDRKKLTPQPLMHLKEADAAKVDHQSEQPFFPG
jgi:hypothetical protein